MKRNILRKSHTLLGLLGSFIALGLVLTQSNPGSLPLPLLLIPSILIGLVVFFFIYFVQLLVTESKKLSFSITAGAYIAGLSLLASLQQLSWRDSILSALLVMLGLFYYKRNIEK